MLALVAAMVLAACASPAYKAPVEDRVARPSGGAQGAPGAAVPAGSVAAESARALPGSENAGKPGYYTVRPGDTLMRIGLDTGQSWRDVARWNNIENPNLVEVGQVLRVVAPGQDAAAATARGVTTARVEARPLDGSAAAPSGPTSVAVAAPRPASAPAAGTPGTPATPAVTTAAAAITPAPAAGARDGDDDVTWAWPASAAVATPFDDARTKGLVFAGKAGDPVLAAADGRVVYAGSGLRGYGNLLIVKHNNTYLTAYAHNQSLLVKEDQVVRRGQKIAEMGASDAERVQLHFELRKLGKPIDPARLLPAR
ncbi:MAG: peptidoglycan DD-metalloendopeptidase family protein [Burkholderiaceae bacterium]